MIVDCAQYIDGVRQDIGPLDIETAAERAGQGGGFVWLGPPRSRRGGAAGGRAGLRPARAGARGRREQAPAPQARGLRRLLLRRAQDRPLRRRARGGRLRRDQRLPRRRLRDRGPPRAASELAPARRRLEARPELVEVGPGRGRLGDPRQGRRRLRARRGGDRQRHRRGRAGGLRRQGRPDRAHLLPPSRGDRVPSRRAAADRAARVPREGDRRRRSTSTIQRYFRDVADHARRVDDQLHDQRDLLARRPRGQPRPGHPAPERGGPRDLRLGGDHRRCRPSSPASTG